MTRKRRTKRLKTTTWIEKENGRRQRLATLRDNKERYKDNIDDKDNFERGITPLEKEIYKFIQNSKSVYEISKEEPSTIYYNIEGKLIAVKIEDVEMMDEIKRQEEKISRRYNDQEEGRAAIMVKLNNKVVTNLKGKNKTKILFILHKMKSDSIDIEMVNWNTARVWYLSKAEANKGLETMEKNSSFLFAYINKKELICKGVITDWPNGIPDLFEAMDDTENIKNGKINQKNLGQ